MYIADLHIHSRYSRATSREGNPENLDLWSRRKGIQILGTGDFTHPAWRQELNEKLIPAEEGFYTLKEELKLKDAYTADALKPRFVVSGEISSIYKKNGRVRKVHNVILLPSLEAAGRLSAMLEAIGNIHSDGRPILGLDSRDLLEITLDTCPEAVFIPAHIWTPHFSLFGAFSGFDTVEECFGDLTPYIRALETGLSSDPPMNWRLSALDGYQLISNSDAHSPSKLGREANLFDIPLSYASMASAIQTGNGLHGTIEFYPEEGKYHFDGHRKCGLALTPAQTREYGGRCPVCGRKITVGVLHRVEELADREDGYRPSEAKAFVNLVPLPEVIGASTGHAAAGTQVTAIYQDMLKKLGSEFYILREAPLEDIRHCAGLCVEEGIRRLRAGEIGRTPGYDGEYGKIQIIDKEEREGLYGQISLFDFAGIPMPAGQVPADETPACPPYSVSDGKNGKEESWEAEAAVTLADLPVTESKDQSEPPAAGAVHGLNPEQAQAVTAGEETVAVIAGPGTGKTKTLVARILWLIGELGVKPADITAVTFTNKAAAEMRERLEKELGGKRRLRGMNIGTFHSICLKHLQALGEDLPVAGERERLKAAEAAISELGLKETPGQMLLDISLMKNSMLNELDGGTDSAEQPDREQPAAMSDQNAGPSEREDGQPGKSLAREAYDRHLENMGLMDFDDILLRALSHSGDADFHTPWLLVDEFQDINEVQYRLISEWRNNGGHLFAIGDPDQSIYGFRGSDAACFTRLAGENVDMRIIRLTRNYRSTPQILKSALAVINQNAGDIRYLTPELSDGAAVSVMTAESDLAEAVYVAKAINRMTGGMDMMDAENEYFQTDKPRDFHEIAVLYRTRRQAKLLEKCLRQESIPCMITGKEDYLEDAQVIECLAFFRFLRNPMELPSACYVLTQSCGCDEYEAESAAALISETVSQGLTWGDGLLAALRERLQARPELTGFFSLLEEFLPLRDKAKPRVLIERWRSLLASGENEALDRLAEAAVLYRSMDAFLDTLLLGEEGDLERSSGKIYTSGAVRLMTLHGSKGLEFPVVFLCGVKKDCIPLKAGHKKTDTEEERRLFYVGMTRAKEELVLLTGPERSAFLDALAGTGCVEADVRKKKPEQQMQQLSLFDLL